MNILKGARFLCQMNQDQVARLVGIDRSKLSRIENGYVKPKPDEKKKIAEILKQKEEVLFPKE